MSTIWENTDGCADQYLYTTALYLLSMLAHAYNFIIDHVVGAPGHEKEVLDVLNANEKRFISMLMATVKLTGSTDYDSYMAMYPSTTNTDIILAREIKNILKCHMQQLSSQHSHFAVCM